MPPQVPAGINIDDLPLASPPPGVVPDFAHPQSRSYQTFMVAGIFIALSLSFTITRIYAKFVVIKSRTWDDYVGIAGMMCVIAYTSVLTYRSTGIFGKHEYEVTVGDYTNSTAEIIVVTNALYGPTVWTVKLALSLLILHIFGRLRWIRFAIWFSILYTFVAYFSSMMIYVIPCVPRAGEINFVKGEGVINVFSDFYLLLVPIPAVLSLQLPLRKKIGVIAWLMTGLLACIASSVGLYYRLNLDDDVADQTWNIIPLTLTLIIEANIGVVVGCMPAFAIVIRHFSSSATFLSSWPNTLRGLLARSLHATSSIFSSRKGKQYKNGTAESDSYVELRDGIRVQHDINLSDSTRPDMVSQTKPNHMWDATVRAGRQTRADGTEASGVL